MKPELQANEPEEQTMETMTTQNQANLKLVVSTDNPKPDYKGRRGQLLQDSGNRALKDPAYLESLLDPTA
jgi:hypothetical protein